jgi:hypothetical protein
MRKSGTPDQGKSVRTPNAKIDWKTQPQIHCLSSNLNGFAFESPTEYLDASVYVNAKNDSNTQYGKVVDSRRCPKRE